MPRSLTSNERNVLEHVVVDANAWWAHANSVVKIDHEDALRAKVARWQASYNTAAAGNDYRPRRQRTDALPAVGPTEPPPYTGAP